MLFRVFSLGNLRNTCSLRLKSSGNLYYPGGGFRVEHDRENLRFTVSLGGVEAGKTQECAVLRYKFTGEKRVDLMSTAVPEAFRGAGVAALLSKAAMDFLAEENLKAHISCWYIKKYIEANPANGYEDHVVHK